MRESRLFTGRTLPPPTYGADGIKRPENALSWHPARVPPAPSDMSVNLATDMWMKSLPKGCVPFETARQYPRIVNRLSRNWDAPAMIEGIFDDLLYAKRRGRKGFPVPVQAEIRNLFNLYQSRNATPGAKEDLWYAERMPALRSGPGTRR